MSDTKERILAVALSLFARKGYFGTSMSDIGEYLQITKAALYKHYSSKQEIFDCILKKMNKTDELRTKEFNMPGENEKKKITLPCLSDFALMQFRFWTEDEFAKDFRRLLTIEQYRDEHMQKLYQQYLGEGQLSYVEEIFEAMEIPAPKEKACEFFAPLFLCYSLADSGENNKLLLEKLTVHFKNFSKNLKEEK